MPHYKDGTLAKIGDVVRGKGYNIPYEIVGVVVDVTPTTEQCNIKVAHAIPHKLGQNAGTEYICPVMNFEYGETAAFEKVAGE